MFKIVLFILIFTISSKSWSAEQQWLLDTRFAGMDITKMVSENYPSLKLKSKKISHYSGFYSINPFLLSEAILNSPKEVSLLAEHLSKTIRLQKSNKSVIDYIPYLNPTSLENINSLMSKYGFNKFTKTASLDNIPALDLPFDHSKEWYFNGVHTWTGENDGSPMSSIDLAKNWGIGWGENTSDYWIAAAHDGVISRFSSCYVRITHPSGWATDYYHLDNILFNNGDEIKAGDLIANYADNLAQATCQGGHSSGPHVHFSLLQDGERFALDGLKLSNWSIHSGSFSYDNNQTRMWIERDGIKKFGYQGKLIHLNGDNIIDYRYNGLYIDTNIGGHAINITISELPPLINTGEIRKIIFVVFYTYDDEGNANFYAGSLDYENWRINDEIIVELYQTNGGNLTDLQSVEFPEGSVYAGTMNFTFADCNELDVSFSLVEPISSAIVEHELELTKAVGLPDYVCQAPSLIE